MCFVFKQKTAYEMRISDWSSDVCSSDLIGHAKSICLNFGLARDFGGRCNLRFDDTNPTKEEQEYVDTIIDSVKWLGFDWKDGDKEHLYFASDYFDQLYEMAEYLISAGHAYVDRSEEHTSELQSLMRISYTVFCLKKKRNNESTVHTVTSETTTS